MLILPELLISQPVPAIPPQFELKKLIVGVDADVASAAFVGVEEGRSFMEVEAETASMVVSKG